MEMTHRYRDATAREIIEMDGFAIARGWRRRFRHFTMEIDRPRAKNGVAHRDHSSARVVVKDGVPFVRHHGRLQEVTATIVTLNNGTEVLFDLRIKSEYLPPLGGSK